MRRERPIRRLNVRFAIILLVAGIVLVGGIVVVHALQIERTAEVTRERGDEEMDRARAAEAAEQSEEANQAYAEAERYYEYAVRLNPEDDHSLVKLALLKAERIEERGGGFRAQSDAYGYLDRAWQRAPGNLEILRHLANFAIRVGRYRDAIDLLGRLIDEFPEEPEWKVKLGQCQMQTDQLSKAEDTFRKIIEDYPDNVDAYVLLAQLLLVHRQNVDLAEREMDNLKKANPKSAEAYLARANFWHGRRVRERERTVEFLANAKADIQEALRLEPGNLDVLLASAQMAILEGDFKRAAEQLDLAAKRHPGEVRIDLVRKTLAEAERDFGLARKHLRAVMDKQQVQSGHRLEDAWLRIQEGNLEGIEADLEKLKSSPDIPREAIDYLNALVLMRQGKWNEALRLLERTNRKGLRPEFTRQLDMMQAECYGAVGMPDRRLAVYAELVAKDPDPRARWGLAKALSAVGKVEDALRHLREVETLLGSDRFLTDPGMRSDLLRLIVAKNLRLPEDQRDWKPAQELVDRITSREDVDELEKVTLRVELLTRMGQSAEARKLIVEAQKSHPRESALWIDLADVVSREEGPGAAMEVLEEGSRKVDPEDRGRLLGPRISLALRLPPGEAKFALDELSSEIDKVAEADRLRFWKVLGAAYYQLRDRQSAKDYWNRVAEKEKDNWSNHMTLFNLAREMDDEPSMDAAAEAIEKLAGAESAEALYCRAARLVWRVRSGKAPRQSLAKATQLVQDAQGKRPNWSVLLPLLADINLLEGDQEKAISNLERASEQGPLSDSYLRKLAELLQANGRADDAKKYLDQLSRREDTFSVKRLEAEIDLQSGNERDALKLAAESMKDSKDARRWLWYGNFLARADKHDEAEAAFRRALELDSQDPIAWLMLVSHLVRHDKMEEARKAVGRARVRLAEDRRALIVGRCYELLGEKRRAEEFYQAAVTSDPQNLTKLRAIAIFYLKNNPTKAEPHLAQIIRLAESGEADASPQVLSSVPRWARQMLARVWAAAGSYERQVRALALLDQNAVDGQLGVEERLIRAAIFASRNERFFREEAIRLLEGIQRESGLPPTDRLRLARLYDQTDQWNPEFVKNLRTEHRGDPQILEGCLRMLLAHFDPLRADVGDVGAGDVEPWLDELEKIKPDAPSTTELRARFLVKQGKVNEGVALLKSLIPQETAMSTEGLRRLNYIAGVLEDLGEIDAAVAVLTEAGQKRAAANMWLAWLLARQRTLDEALDKCEAAGAELPASQIFPGAIQILDLQPQQVTEAHLDRVETMLAKIPSRYHRSRSILPSLARFREIQGRYDEAVAAYREYLSRDDVTDRQRAAIWNNVAYILAVQNRQPDEALEMVNKAIAVLGPGPELLDTRGVVYLALDQPERALADLDRAIKDRPSAARYFHLALAHHDLKEQQEAERYLRTARREHRLTPESLPPIERERYKKLVASLDGAR